MEDEMETGEVTVHSTVVEKALPVDIDLGHLLLSDTNDVSDRSLKSSPEAYLKTLARDNAQLLINEIWKLPFERVDDVVVTKLPKPTYVLPREKPAPKPKPLTKWESYAKEKGIKKMKKTKLVWDEIVKKWVPRYGYRRVEADQEKDWCIEVPANADPNQDMFEKKAEVKAEKVAKNELQRLRNLARAKKVEVPKAGLTSKPKPSKGELHQAVHVAKKATASLGKFQAKLPKEKPLKGTGKKRQFDPLVIDSAKEKSKNLDVLDKIMNKKPKIDVEKAVNRNFDFRVSRKPAFREKSDKSARSSGPKMAKRSEGKRRGGAGAAGKAKGKGFGNRPSGRGVKSGGAGGGRGKRA